MCEQLVENRDDEIIRLGKFLVDKTASYPDFIEEIVAASANISYEWLLIVRKVGYGFVHPPLVHHYQTPGVRRISKFQLGQQIKLWKSGVTVVSKGHNGFIQKHKQVCNMSHKDVMRAFARKDTLRTVEEQIEFIRTQGIEITRKFIIHGNAVSVTRKCALNHKEVLEIARGVLSQNDLISLLSKTNKRAA